MKKVILKLLLIIYILFIVLTTFLLLKQNEFKVSVINNKSVFVLNNDLYITKNKSKYEVNDKIYYSNKSGKIYSAKINAIKNNNYILDNNENLQAEGKGKITVEIIGDAGLGKTSLIEQIAQERGARFVKINLSQLEEVGD